MKEIAVSKNLLGFLNLVGAEVTRAQDQHATLNSAHEGYAVIKEEFDELWEEIRRRVHDRGAILEELVHLTAMCCRFADELIDPDQIARKAKR